MSSEVKNIDTILVQSMQEQSAGLPTQPTVEPTPLEQQHNDVSSPSSSDEPVAQENKKEEVTHGTSESDNNEVTKSNNNEDSPIDEYGNPIEPPKMYTEDEVQRMMRDRLSRVKQPESAPPRTQPIDDSGEQDWRQELKTFVKQTVNELTQEEQETQWRQQESQRQAEFESKFTSGMGKYQDFHQVVAGKPITNQMMLATRSLENPAAFVYGAAKMHPQELDRISRISDPYQQAAEIGRLHEKMVKSRATISNAPKPIEQPKGNMPNKPVNDKPSIDSLILQHAAAKNKR